MGWTTTRYKRADDGTWEYFAHVGVWSTPQSAVLEASSRNGDGSGNGFPADNVYWLPREHPFPLANLRLLYDSEDHR